MDYMPTIYACGDAYYLGKVLDAVAMICGTNGGLVGATAVGALIGVIIIAFQTVIRLNGINIHHMIVCWVIYVISFGTTIDVGIQSVYSDGTVVQKDNVPAGPAWIGVIVSNIGYYLTKQMEQAFGDVDEKAVITNNNGNGFANALYILNHMSQFGETGKFRAAMANTTTGRDILTNLTVYARDCTTKAIYLGPKWKGKTYEQVITEPFETGFEFDSNVYYTEVRDNGQTLELSCREAWKTIKNQMNGKAFDEIDSYTVHDIASSAGFCTVSSDGSTNNCNVEDAQQLMDRFQQVSLNAVSESAVKAQKFMMTSVGRNILNLGLAQGYATYKDMNTAAMLTQAIEQRNVQWAAEQSMFLNSVRPMMAFMESFFYALTPFAAVFVMLGLFGLGLFFKYILLLIWVQMWLPVMAVANMYIMSAAKREISSIIAGYSGQHFKDTMQEGSISIYAYDQMLGAAKDWVATGAMFQAATPLLSLIIITGSVYALTSLTGRMAGADHINEKIVAPDVVAPAAAIGMEAAYKANTFGAFLNGAKAPMLNITEALNAQNSYATEQAHQSVKQLQHEFNNAVLESGGWGNMHALVGSSTWQKGSSSEKALTTNVQKIKEFANSVGAEMSDGTATEIAMAMAAGVEGSGKGAGVKSSPSVIGSILNAVNASVNASTTSKEAKTGAIKDAITELSKGGFSISDSDKVSIIEGVSGSFSEQGSTGNTHQKMGSRGESLKEALSDARSKVEKSQQVKAYSQTLGYSRTLDLFDIANRAGAEGFAQLYAEVKANIESKYGEGAGIALDSYASKWERENKSNFPLGTNSDIAGKINALLNFDFGQNGMDQEDFDVRDKFFNKLNEVVALPMNSGYQGGSDAFNTVDPNGPYDTDYVGGQNVKTDSDALIEASKVADKNPIIYHDQGGKQAQTAYDTLEKSKRDEVYHKERIQHAKNYKATGMDSLLVGGTWTASTGEKGFADSFTDALKQRIPGHSNVVDPGNKDYFYRDIGKKENQEIVMSMGYQAAADRGFVPNDDSSPDQADLVDKIQKLYSSTYLENGDDYHPYEYKDGTVLDQGHATYTQFVNGKVQAADRNLKGAVADLARSYGYSDQNAEDYAENVSNLTKAAAIGDHNAEKMLTRIVKGDNFGGTSLPSMQELQEATQSNQPVQTPNSTK